jgi:glycosyltransferase involved in cell wall biosynthesis
MSALPGVSVVLPVYFPALSTGAVGLLRRALDSLCDQHYRGLLEIVLVDDGSPTAIESIAYELGPSAKQVRWVRLARNSGIAAALNTGIATASHPLIARLDADDRWLPGKLGRQVALFQDDPDLSIVGTAMVCVTPEGEEIDRHIRPADWTQLLRFFVDGGCPFPHGSVVARRDIYRLLGGYSHDATFRHCEDYALWSTWLRFFKATMIEEVLYEYRVSAASVSVQHAARQSAASVIVRNRFAALNLSSVLPSALTGFAQALGLPMLTAGRLAYTVWQNPSGGFALPEEALAPLAAMLPDRVLEPVHRTLPWWVAIDAPARPQSTLKGIAAKPCL